ncbi:Ferric-pseudobactin 358 receptor [Alphaproteobacteria bacterium SO-S41]|nr:Ferric-pseudobactin 358 receptor [Alphaproteobacteria bacterium SO-S41]
MAAQTVAAAQQAAATATTDEDTTEAASDESIVVTATRRSQRLFEVPATVTALSGEQLRNDGIIKMQDIIANVPNAVIQEDSESNNTYINIRGMRVVDVQAEPNFGLYRNGLYAGGHRSNLGAQVDIERVEVLRGPQGGLYGRSAVGGAVNVVSAMPTSEFGGYIKASYGTYDRAQFEGAINAPVNDKVAVRLAAWYFNQEDSELYNETLNEPVSAFTDKGVRASIKAELSSKLTAEWMFEYQKFNGPSLITYGPVGILTGTITSPPETVKRIRRDTPSISAWNQATIMQKLSYETEVGTFDLNASYRDYKLDAVFDSDQTAVPITTATSVRNTEIIRDEGTSSYFVEGVWTSPSDQPLTWIAGVSYFDETFDFVRTIHTKRDLTFLGMGTGEYYIGFPKPGTNVHTQSISAFASVSYQVNDALQLTAGLRWSHDQKDLTFKQGIISIAPPAAVGFLTPILSGIYPNYDIAMTSDFYFTAPSFVLKYAFSDDFNFYASYTTGFRPGAFNLSPTTLATIPYDQESADNYEIGFKSRWLDNRLDVNLALFYMRQKDMLLALTTQLAGVDRTYLDNIGTGNTYGVELEVNAKLASWLTGGLNVGWLDAKFDNAVANPGLPTQKVLSGLAIPYTREWTVNLRLDADVPISDTLRFVGSAMLRYESGGILGDYYRVDPYDTMTKIDLTAGVVINDQTRVTAYVDNALDEHIHQFFYYNGGTNTSVGRTAGIEITHNF